MAKTITRFVCQNCGASSTKWMGFCSQCDSWNTYEEEVVKPGNAAASPRQKSALRASSKEVQTIQEVDPKEHSRLALTDPELSRVLGGGIIPGSVVLLAGQPGIGKSTLLLQVACQNPMRILYITGEESKEQVRMRADRIGIANSECYLHCETNLADITRAIEQVRPSIVILDSVQTVFTEELESAPGTISQIRECAAQLQQYAKTHHIAIFLIGHITKEGSIAGPKVLEHIVDVVLQFEGDPHYHYRILRCMKNRFGSTDEMGIYAMGAEGLSTVDNPSEIFLSHAGSGLSGSAVSVILEGQRALMMETQALVSHAVYGTAQRSATGFDTRRLHMLLAVLEKRSGFLFSQQDVFLNLAGGLKVADPALDLAVVAALVSSLQDIPIDAGACFAGEVGLSGEIRGISRVEQRIKEADRLGFSRLYLPEQHRESLETFKGNIRLVFIGSVHDLISEVFA